MSGAKRLASVSFFTSQFPRHTQVPCPAIVEAKPSLQPRFKDQQIINTTQQLNLDAKNTLILIKDALTSQQKTDFLLAAKEVFGLKLNIFTKGP